MAITQLASGQIAAAIAPAVPSATVNVLAGSNRMFLVAVMAEWTGFDPVVVTGVPVITLGGVNVPRLSDGTFAGAVAIPTSSSASRVGVFWYAMRELDYPGAGNQQLALAWPAVNGTNWTICTHWWQLRGVAQPPLPLPAASVQNFWFGFSVSTAATVVSGTRPAGLADDAVFWSAIKKGVNGTLVAQLDGVTNATEFLDVVGAGADVIQFRTVSSKTLAAPVGAGTTSGVLSLNASPQGMLVLGARIRSAVVPAPGSVYVSATRRGSVEVSAL